MKRGFTLIELLVVISIIALLSSVVMSSLNVARAKGRYTSATSQMRQLKLAAESYYSAIGSYPLDTSIGTMPSGLSTYISAWPTPPCSNYVYDWNNVSNLGTNINVDMRTISPSASVYTYCIYSSTGSCGGVDIMTVASKQLSC